LNIDGETTAVLPSTESQFVINDGEIGRRYIIQLEVRLENKIFEISISRFLEDDSKGWEKHFINSG
jgi:hypothetical protein